MKEVVKSLIPIRLKQALKRQQGRLFGMEGEFQGLSNKEIFQKIYQEKLWGRDQEEGPCSGAGSHNPQIVSAYVESIKEFLAPLGKKKTLVDLGCGDFNIGSKIAALGHDYIACDIVGSVIEFNKKKFSLDNVEFRTHDLVKDELPQGDILFVRQVLQHLSNQDIQSFVDKLNRCQSYSHLIVTEHLPAATNFRPNRDKPSGAGVRVSLGSGVDLAASPFQLSFDSSHVICEVTKATGGVEALLRTTSYCLKTNP